MNMAERIQSLRKAKGISQEELSEQIGVSRQAVSKWESAQSTPDIDKIILLSDYFDTTTDYLLKGIEPAGKQTKPWDAVLFSAAGTVLNGIGLITALTIWIERQTACAAGAGIVIMLFGTMLFMTGQILDCRNKPRAKRCFILPNVWLLLLIPMSCCFNILDGLLGGYSGMIAPVPCLGNSLLTFALFWFIYFLVCIVVDIKAMRTITCA